MGPRITHKLGISYYVNFFGGGGGGAGGLKLNYCNETALNFLPWEFLLVKMLEIKKTKTTFIICISFKSCILGGLSFFEIQLFD